MIETGVAAIRTEAVTDTRIALEVKDLVVKYGDVAAVKGVSFQVLDGEFVTLLGPSGCGKTTTLRCIAGLEDLTSGYIEISGHRVADAGKSVPTQDRNINMVFQSYAVWPHMTVRRNVAYGLSNKGLSKAEIRERTDEALAMVRLEAFAERYATELSGGQQQRVALARAVVTKPDLLLFDEPLSNLDAGLRERMREEIMQLHRRIGRAAIYVTHDQSEAMAMSDRVILMNVGSIEQTGRPRELYGRPRTRFAAEFIGTTNILSGEVARRDGRHWLNVPGLPAPLALAGLDDSLGEHSFVCRPESVIVETAATAGRSENAFAAEVVSVAYLGNACDLVVSVGDYTLRVSAPGDLDVPIGAEVTVVLPPERLVRIEEDR